jgi:hypothetical protein
MQRVNGPAWPCRGLQRTAVKTRAIARMAARVKQKSMATDRRRMPVRNRTRCSLAAILGSKGAENGAVVVLRFLMGRQPSNVATGRIRKAPHPSKNPST